MLSLTGEIKTKNKDGALSLNDVSRRYASADSSPAKRKTQPSSSEPCESHDSTIKSSHFSLGKGVPKRTEGKTHKVESGEKGHHNQQQQQQWSTPLLASNAALKRIQSEEKILRRLSEPLGTATASASATGTGTGTATKKTIISPSKDSSLRIVPHRETEREKERGRSSERKNRSASASRDVCRVAEKAALKQQQPDHTVESEYSFEQEREASYLNKHLGISSAEELWQDNLIGEHLCVCVCMCVCVCVCVCMYVCGLMRDFT